MILRDFFFGINENPYATRVKNAGIATDMYLGKILKLVNLNAKISARIKIVAGAIINRFSFFPFIAKHIPAIAIKIGITIKNSFERAKVEKKLSI